MLYPLLIAVFLLASGTLACLAVRKYREDRRCDTYELLTGWTAATAVIACAVGVIWTISYVDRWETQREIESFVESKVYVEFAAKIEGAAGNTELVDLNPVGRNLETWYLDIKRYNECIQCYNANNASWWFDLGTPDWDAPELITFAEGK